MKAVVILEVMWDWRNVTASAGYRAQAPRWFQINPENHTGRRLHRWLTDYDFIVTNACPELVESAKHRGKPDEHWLRQNITDMRPFDLMLVCGRVAQATYDHELYWPYDRILEIPHPAARQWTRQGIELVHQTIAGTDSGRIVRKPSQFILEPFAAQLSRNP